MGNLVENIAIHIPNLPPPKKSYTIALNENSLSYWNAEEEIDTFLLACTLY